MSVRGLLDDSAAFSSVIGIVLLVAVAVIIGATVSILALGFVESTQVAPTASIQFEYDYFGDGVPQNDSVTVIHTGGDRLERERLEVRIGPDTVYNETADSESNSDTNNVEGLVVEVDDDEFNDLNKPGDLSPSDTVGGPPGDGDGSDPGVVLEWEEEVKAGQRIVFQERNYTEADAPPGSNWAYDVIQPGERIQVIWRGRDSSAIIAEDTIASEYAEE
jgi:FlaG/FlaF family flagellin (archaellin)